MRAGPSRAVQDDIAHVAREQPGGIGVEELNAGELPNRLFPARVPQDAIRRNGRGGARHLNGVATTSPCPYPTCGSVARTRPPASLDGVKEIPSRLAASSSGCGPSLTASCAKYALQEWTKPSCMSIARADGCRGHRRESAESSRGCSRRPGHPAAGRTTSRAVRISPDAARPLRSPA